MSERANPAALLEVEDLKVQFKLKRENLLSAQPILHAVDGVSFVIDRGKTLGLVGESGCGKSTSGLALLGLVTPSHGTLLFDGVDLSSLNREEMFPGLKTRPGMTELTESCIRVWNDENDGYGFFIAVFTQTESEHDSARATRAHPRDEGREPIPIEPKPPGQKDLRIPKEEDMMLFDEWGLDSHGLAMWRRGHFAHLSTEGIRDWMWAAPRLTAKNRLYPGGHWQPMRVLQACLLYTSPSQRDRGSSRMPASA